MLNSSQRKFHNNVHNYALDLKQNASQPFFTEHGASFHNLING